VTERDDIGKAIEVVRDGLVGVIEAADPNKLVRIATFIRDIDETESGDLMTALREEAGRR
jgi:hypothetical protein